MSVYEKGARDEVKNTVLEKDAAEKARQAERYDELYNSVLCGIVQYRLEADGSVIFENANREAMRIFGYEAEEFWAKNDWNLPDLIAAEDRETVLASVERLQKVGDKSSYEYRLRKKDGSSCWIIGSAEIILNTDGIEVVQSVFLDIDVRKQAEIRNKLLSEQVAASNELLRLALEHTTTCECYYYPRRHLLLMPDRARDYYKTSAEYTNMPEDFANERVDSAYKTEFCGMLSRIDCGEKTANLEFKVKGREQWCRATFSVLEYNDAGESEMVVGVLEDITPQKKMEHALDDAKCKDSLTGLYNKEFGTQLVQESLRERPAGECYAMMLLDMDDFSKINSDEGVAFADAVLQEVADILSSEVGDDGLCVRLGGDEFMLLIRGCNKAAASVRGPRIAERVRDIFAMPEKDIRISVSIGMCVTDVTEEYASLYRCAESTLKYVKEHGKGTAACYLDTSNEQGIFLTQLYTDEHPVNEIEHSFAPGDEDLVSVALELLGKAKNLDDAVFLLFSRIGKSLGLDRVSITDVNKDYLSYSYSYQWARNHADLQLGEELYVPSGYFDKIIAMYNSDDNFCEQTTDKLHIKGTSFLHAGIWNYGNYIGSMIFEVNRKDYKWNAQQRKLLKELVKIVPSFLMKVKADAISKAKTDFLSRMSHEIRTPMNAISGMTTIAKSVLDDREKTMDCLEKIETANNYLLDLINDILDMSRIENGKLDLNCEPLDLGDLIDRIDVLLQPQAHSKGIALTFERDFNNDRLVIADGLRLNQVLINIIGNAIKFTDPGGSVVVRAEQSKTDSSTITFSVKDTGIGIESLAINRIFNAFEQADKDTVTRHGGTGLGLAISNRLVQLMGGELAVESQVGVGSKFFFSIHFDHANRDIHLKKESVDTTHEYDFSGLRILVAEDNNLNQEIVKTILEMHGFETVCVDDGVEAVDAFVKNDVGYFDAVLMDIRMPNMDGLEATRRIRTSEKEDSRSIPIIALTANAFDEDSRKSLESGMNGHLSKPLQIDQLLNMLDVCLNSSELD